MTNALNSILRTESLSITTWKYLTFVMIFHTAAAQIFLAINEQIPPQLEIMVWETVKEAYGYGTRLTSVRVINVFKSPINLKK